LKELNVVFTYKYVNSNGDKHDQEIVFDSGGINVIKLKEFEKRLIKAFSGKKNLFNSSQLELPDLFHFVPNYHTDTSMHSYVSLDFTTHEIMDFRAFSELVYLAEEESEKGWKRFDVLEKVTGRVARNVYLKEIETIHKSHTKEIGLLLREHTKSTNQITKNNNKEISQLKNNYAKEIKLLTGVHSKERDMIDKIHTKEIETLKKSYGQELSASIAEHKKSMGIIERKLNKSKEILTESSEMVDLYLDGEASSDDLEKLVTKIKKIKAGL